MILGLFISFSLLFTVVISQGSQTAQKQTRVDSKATSCNINNNFYAGPNKKMENLILDVKRQLDEIRKDLKISPKNENYKPQGKSFLCYYNFCLLDLLTLYQIQKLGTFEFLTLKLKASYLAETYVQFQTEKKCSRNLAMPFVILQFTISGNVQL